MNGPAHYKRAEQWAGIAEERFAPDDFEPSIAAAAIARVHAELAATAATVRSDVTKFAYSEQEEWAEVLGD